MIWGILVLPSCQITGVYSVIIRVKLIFAHLYFLFLLLRNNFTPRLEEANKQKD
jgi:hypothetical protein